MSTFVTTKQYEVSSSFIPNAVEAIRSAFTMADFNFEMKPGSYNKTVIEVTKGSLVKQCVGLKQGLQISFESVGNHVNVEARGIVLKNQLIASGISIFITWPVVIPQIIGLIKQSKLDEKAISVVDAAYATYRSERPVFCTHCGERVTGGSSHCPHCGGLL